jgi:hypothetical protein
MENRIRHEDELTPITKDSNNTWLKRDDLYEPYIDLPIRGNKVRQLKALIEHNMCHITDECDGKVYVGLFSTSSQGVVLSRVIKDYKDKVSLIIFHGMKRESVKKNKLCLNAIVQGAIIDTSAKAGYDSVIQAELSKRRTAGERFFDANLSHNVDTHPNEVLFTIADQVKNLPELDTLYVPVGSGYTMAGVILGISKFMRPVKRIVGVCVSDNCEATLRKICNIISRYYVKTFNLKIDCVDCNMGYHKEVKSTITDEYGTEQLDTIYEGKAYKRMLEVLNPEEVNGFWVSGNMNAIRNNVYGLKEALKGAK